MTIDEAIRDCIAQVPETCPVGFKWYEDQSPRAVMPLRGWRDTSLRQPPGVIHTIKPEYFRALWFDAAWEWLARQNKREDVETEFWPALPYDDSCHGAGLWAVREIEKWADDDGFDCCDHLPTKYHALCRAVLLAKELKP
jgi:hypothetical protein